MYSRLYYSSFSFLRLLNSPSITRAEYPPALAINIVKRYNFIYFFDTTILGSGALRRFLLPRNRKKFGFGGRTRLDSFPCNAQSPRKTGALSLLPLYQT